VVGPLRISIQLSLLPPGLNRVQMFDLQFLQDLLITFLGGFGQVFAFFRVQLAKSPDGQMRDRGDLRGVIVRVTGQADP
jgi:hypothetical protein